MNTTPTCAPSTRRGFTLLELIVVIVILGILALLAIPTFNAVIGKSKQQTITSMANAIGRETDMLASFDSGAANGYSGPNNTTYVSQAADNGDFPSNSFVRSSSPPSWTYTPPSWSYTVGRTSMAGVHACLTLGTTYGERSVAVDGACAGYVAPTTTTTTTAPPATPVLYASDDDVTTTTANPVSFQVLGGDTVDGVQVTASQIVVGSVQMAAIAPENGSIVNNTGGNFTYTAPSGFTGQVFTTYSWTYKDGQGNPGASVTGNVTINVN